MSRRTDYGIAVALLVIPIVLLGIYTTRGYTFALLIGVVSGIGVAPICYKLIAYPPTRKNTLGEVVADARQDDDAGPLGTGGMLVCFSGIDGSGKTTEAEAIIEDFQEAGVDATHVWARWRPFLSYPFMGVLFVTLGWRRKDYHKSRLVQRIWGYFLLADHLLFFARFIYPHLRRGRVVCIDRYVLDQLVEMKYDGVYRERPASLIRRWLPTPDVTFLMDVPAEIAAERKTDTGEMLDRLDIDDEPIDYLRKRRNYFLEVSSPDVVQVNTTRAMKETHSEISERVWQRYLNF